MSLNHSRSLEIAPSIDRIRVPIGVAVTIGVSRIISEVKRSEIFVENRDFMMPLAFDAPVRGFRRSR